MEATTTPEISPAPNYWDGESPLFLYNNWWGIPMYLTPSDESDELPDNRETFAEELDRKINEAHEENMRNAR